MFQLYFSFYCVIIQCVFSEIIVNTKDGDLIGKLVEDSGYQYYAYLSIPYAEAPIGPLRFKPPVPKSSWTTAINATSEPPLCPQTSRASTTYSRDQMSEDCLYLNVFVPYNPTELGLLPVAVYIHGGEFKALSSRSDYQMGPHFFTERDVILITMNYRLGPLGFLSLNIDDALGNMGLKDVVLALKWIQNNVEHYGGDPNKITIGGQSSGSAMVQYLTLSTQTIRLFHRAFLNSGSALGYRFFSKHPEEVAFRYGKVLGINTENKTELLNQLLQIDAFDLIDAADILGANDTRKAYRPFSAFVPTVEIKSSTAIITKDPYEIIKSGIPQNVPFLAGFSGQDGLKMYPTVRDQPGLLDSIAQDHRLLIPSDIEYPHDSDKSKDLAEKIKQFYFGDGEIRDNILYNYVNLVTDAQIAYSVDSWIRLHKSRNDSADLYYYVFNFDGELNWSKIVYNITVAGTGHGDELGYLFLTKATRSIFPKINTRTNVTLDNFMTYWTNFVKYGDPESNNTDRIWTETGKDRVYLDLNDTPNLICNSPILERMQFWQQVYDDYYNYLENGGVTQDRIFP